MITDMDGKIPFTEVFRPVNTKKIIVDNYGKEWLQITALGYKRVCDNFFWPANPTNNNNHLNQLPPTVEEVAKPYKLPDNGICVDLNTGQRLS
jgi:hypothetical protein